MEIVGSGVKDNRARPDSLELLNYKRMRQKALRLGSDGDFQCRDSRHSCLGL